MFNGPVFFLLNDLWTMWTMCTVMNHLVFKQQHLQFAVLSTKGRLQKKTGLSGNNSHTRGRIY